MSDFGEIIASEKFIGESTDGERFEITIEIGRPYKWGGSSPTEWACPVRAEPFFSLRTGIHGEGSLQALCLALRHVRSILEDFIEKGGTISLDGSAETVSLNSYW